MSRQGDRGARPAGRGGRALRPPLAAALVAISLSLVALDRLGPMGPALTALRGAARGALAPVEAAGEATLGRLGDTGAGLVRSRALGAENARLRRALDRSRSAAAQAEALRRQNVALSAGRGLSAPGGPPSVVARVVSLPSGRPGSTLALDRGRDAGVRPGMAVVASGALVGRVVEASSARAGVLPLSDPASAVGVRLVKTGETGLAQGLGWRRSLRVDFFDPEAQAQPSELVVTSGLRHGRFPPGLPVGRISGRVLGGTGGLGLIADPDRLEVVEVLEWRPPE